MSVAMVDSSLQRVRFLLTMQQQVPWSANVNWPVTSATESSGTATICSSIVTWLLFFFQNQVWNQRIGEFRMIRFFIEMLKK